MMKNFELTDEMLDAIEEAIISLDIEGGVPHDQVMEKMKNKYPWAFK